MTGSYSLAPVWFSDVVGSTLMIVISFGAVWYASRLKKVDPSNVIWMYLLVLSVALAGFSISRSVAHLAKHLMLMTGHLYVWELFRPYTGAINSSTFIVVAAVTIFFQRVQRINAQILADKVALEKATQDIGLLNRDLEGLVEKRTLELSLSEKKYRGIFEGSMDMIFVLDDQLNFEDMNPSGLATLGYDSNDKFVQLVSLNEIFFSSSDYDDLLRDLSLSGSIRDRECRVREKSGLEVFILLSLTATIGDSGKEKSYVGIAKDITARRRMERQLQQADRLASLGQTAAGIAHELNTPLGIILGYTQLLLRNCQESDDAYGDLQIIEKHTRTCKRIVQDLLRFTRDSGTKKSYVDLVTCFDEVTSFFGHQFEKEGITVESRVYPGLPKVFADGEKLKQVLVNLLLNAKQAISGNGIIVMAARFDPEQQEILISVSDNGCGMSPKTAGKIFDPFFTTKPVGEGTGLGLSVSYGIIQAHGGRLEVESEEGLGTTFTILLPLVEESRENFEQKRP